MSCTRMTALYENTETVHCQTVPMIGKDKDIESDDEARRKSMTGQAELHDSRRMGFR